MITSHSMLWQKVRDFNLDDNASDFKFSTRLARENGWSAEYTERVIDEYKKFIFLCCISNHGITPSDPVDQAWHLHLTYTKSYWQDLCQHTLQKEIHHNPTKGGIAEANKFDAYYTATRDSYIKAFGHPPPEDIWQSNEERFSDIDFQRVNLRKNWIIKKPGGYIKGKLAILAIVLIGISSIFATGYDYIGFAFFGVAIILVIYIVVKVKDIRLRKNKNSGNDGCSVAGCSDAGCSNHHHGDSGCNSGCSGDSGSGCSGCSGGSD